MDSLIQNIAGVKIEPELRPKLKNFSRDLNLRRDQLWLVPLKIVFNVSRFKPAFN